MQPCVVIADSFGWARYESLNLLTQSHNDRDDSKVISDTLHQTKFYHYKMLQLYFHTITLRFFLSMFSGRCITVRPKLLSVDGWYPATPGRSRSRQHFTDSSSESDSGKNGRLRLTPTLASTPTPQPCLLVTMCERVNLAKISYAKLKTALCHGISS